MAGLFYIARKAGVSLRQWGLLSVGVNIMKELARTVLPAEGRAVLTSTLAGLAGEIKS
jgi:hypothetical protein